MKIWTCGSSSRSGSRNAWMRIKNVNGASRLIKFGFFSARSIWFPVGRYWWPWTKPGYITMTRRQSNNQWSGGTAAHPSPKNSECKNSLEKFSPRIFWDQDGILFVDYLPKGQSINDEYYSSVMVQLKDIFKEKHRGKFTKMPRLTGYVQPRRNLLTWASSVLITHPILRIWPRQTTTFSLDWKTIWKVAIFRPTRRSLLPLRPGWTDNLLNFFWVACKS